MKEKQKHYILIEGLLPNRDGGNYKRGEYTTEEIVDSVNGFLQKYDTVNIVPNYPHGKTTEVSKEINGGFIENLLIK